MTNKEFHVLHFWHAKLDELNHKEARYVSVGELARYVGQSTETARKYLKALKKEKLVSVAKRQHPNKIKYDVYHTGSTDNDNDLSGSN